MDWVWLLLRPYVLKRLKRTAPDASDDVLEAEFVDVLSSSTVTVLVQEPWRGSVRFKCLARFDSNDMFPLLADPEAFLRGRFGGGKFKLNFHHGLHFVATRNFKPEGEPIWMDLPEIESALAS